MNANTLTLRVRYLAVTIGAAMLVAGCGPQASSNALPATPILDGPNFSAAYQNAISSGDLLYVTGVDNERVRVFTYPQDQGVRLKRFAFPLLAGDCADAKGNVYIIWADFTSAGFISEYPHGKDKAIRRLSSYDILGDSQCSIDPTNGDLAVTEGLTIQIFDQKGESRRHHLPSRFGADTCAYDDRGNLYINTGEGFGHANLFELAKGSSRVVQITLPRAFRHNKRSAAIRWDGKYLAFTNGEHTVYQLTISGTRARIAGQTQLEDVQTIGNIWIQNNTIVGSNAHAEVFIWKYPAGGKPINHLTFKNAGGIGVAVSVPPPR